MGLRGKEVKRSRVDIRGICKVMERLTIEMRSFDEQAYETKIDDRKCAFII